MSVLGFNFGNDRCFVAVARQGQGQSSTDAVPPETLLIECFDKQYFLGTDCVTSSMMNAISHIKRLIGVRFSDPELQCNLKLLPFSVTEGPDGYPLMRLGENEPFTPKQFFVRALSELKTIAENNVGAVLKDCCIGIPVFLTSLQREAVKEAAEGVGLNPLLLFHETTATALNYGIYQTDLTNTESLAVAFVDVGHASMQVTIVSFRKGKMTILSHAFDRLLGVLDFDEVVFQNLAAKLNDVDQNQTAKAGIEFRAACEKMRLVLSLNEEANQEASLNIEGLMEASEFNQIIIPILERMKNPLKKALDDSGLSIEGIHYVEVVGPGSHVPAVLKILAEFFGKEPRRTMVESECVSRGCALQCAILSKLFNVKNFYVNEKFPLNISLLWKSSTSDRQIVVDKNDVFPKGTPMPKSKLHNVYRSQNSILDVQDAGVDELRPPTKMRSYDVGPFKSDKERLDVRLHLNLSGIVSITSVMLRAEDVKFKLLTTTTDQAPTQPVQMETDAKPQSVFDWHFEKGFEYDPDQEYFYADVVRRSGDFIEEGTLIRYRDYGKATTERNMLLRVEKSCPEGSAFVIRVKSQIFTHMWKEVEVYDFVIERVIPYASWIDGQLKEFLKGCGKSFEDWQTRGVGVFKRGELEQAKIRWWEFIGKQVKRLFRGVVRGLWVLSSLDMSCLGLSRGPVSGTGIGVFISDSGKAGKIKPCLETVGFVQVKTGKARDDEILDNKAQDVKGLRNILYSIVVFPFTEVKSITGHTRITSDDDPSSIAEYEIGVEMEQIFYRFQEKHLSAGLVFENLIDAPFFWTKEERIGFLFKFRDLHIRKQIAQIGVSGVSGFTVGGDCWFDKIELLKSNTPPEEGDRVLSMIYETDQYFDTLDAARFSVNTLKHYNEEKYIGLRTMRQKGVWIEYVLRKHIPNLYSELWGTICDAAISNSVSRKKSMVCQEELLSCRFAKGKCDDPRCQPYLICDHILE